MSPPADDAVITAAKSGDEGAWRELYAALGGRLVGWLRSQPTLDSALDAEDLASETWLTAARRVNEFNGSTDDFAGWIFVIARNLALNTGRRSIRRATTPTPLDPRELVTEQTTTDEGAEVDSREWIRQLLDMPEQPRTRRGRVHRRSRPRCRHHQPRTRHRPVGRAGGASPRDEASPRAPDSGRTA